MLQDYSTECVHSGCGDLLLFLCYRTIVLNVCTLGVVIYFWFTNVNCSERLEDEEKWLDVENECTPVRSPSQLIKSI